MNARQRARRRRHRGNLAAMIAFVRWGLPIVAIAAALDVLRASADAISGREPFTGELWGWWIWYAYVVFIGLAVLAAAAAVVHWIPRHGRRQYAAVALAVIAAGALSYYLCNVHHVWRTYGSLSVLSNGYPVGEYAGQFGTALLVYLTLGMLIVGAWLYVRAEAQQAEVLQQVAVDSARMDQQTAEARLQVLEAQIEPHFLFNTLAHVKRLYEIDPAGGARMLRNLKAYLAVALPQMRETESTLARELTHVTAYLNVQQIRMGRRLAFAIDVPPDLRGAAMPSLMILTLVENAIKHGLGPAQAGGRIDVRASAEGGRLRVDVADTGQGFAKAAGGGTGLANVRARLKSLFGDAASLSLAINAPRGVVATLILPQRSMNSPGAGT